MRSSRQLNEEFARKVEQLSATSDRLNFELFRKNEIREAIKGTAVSIKSGSWGVYKKNSFLQGEAVRSTSDEKTTAILQVCG